MEPHRTRDVAEGRAATQTVRMSSSGTPLRIAALVKQIPAAEEMELGPDGRLVRSGTDLEMSAYCRRAVAKAVELAAERPGSTVTVLTLGPPSAEDTIREGVAWGLDRDVDSRGVLLSDPVFAGSDTIATARALAALLRREGPFDLVLLGKNSLDSDTGQVPPQLAELLDLPFATGVKQIAIADGVATVGCERDDEWVDAEIRLPFLLSCAERLCDPCKVKPDGRAAVPADRIVMRTAADLEDGAWGEAASRTWVGTTKSLPVQRLRQLSPDAPLATQVKDAVRVLVDRGALAPGDALTALPIPATGGDGHVVAVVAEPGHPTLTRELCGLAARLAAQVGGSTALLTAEELGEGVAGSWGADVLVRIQGAEVEEDIARGVAEWASDVTPWAVFAGSTAFGREVASRAAAAIDAGLTGDAVDVEVDGDRLVAWKPAFGGQLVAAITASSPVQMATIRAGVLPRSQTRVHTAEVRVIDVVPRGRVVVLDRRREDSVEGLAEAHVVIGIGRGIGPDEVGILDELRDLLGAELGCTRKITDAGWMPHARQIGITGRSIAPRLFISVGASGKFNHMVGVRGAGTVLAINPDPGSLVFDVSDVGIVASYQDAGPLLVEELRAALG
jgi:electron transfer flavoprotein alpha subunit